MSHVEQPSVTIVTATGGGATGYLPTTGKITGIVNTIRYAKVDFANGVDFTITSERTGETLWTEANVNAAVAKSPGRPVHTTSGAAALHATGGTALLRPFALKDDRIKIVIAQGGNTKSGTFTADIT